MRQRFSAAAHKLGAKTKTVIGIVLFVVLIVIIKFAQILYLTKMHAYTPPPESVTTATVLESSWEDTFSSVATLTAVHGAVLSAEEPGEIAKIYFQSGDEVSEGTVLAEIDTSVEEANLKGSLAMKSRMQRSYERAQSLHQKNAISNDEYELTVAQYQQAVSQADALQATIKRKQIVAPFSGTTGIRTVNIGQYVAAGAPIVPLFSSKELFINFTVPQAIAEKIKKDSIIKIATDSGAQGEGTVSAINPNVDESTRNVSVQGQLQNNGSFRSGMFVTVTVPMGTPRNLLTIPISSVQYAPYGDSIYKVMHGDDGGVSLKQIFVKSQAKRGDQIAVVSTNPDDKDSLKAGDEVVTSGLFKLRPGGAVLINNSVKPSDTAHPQPQDS